MTTPRRGRPPSASLEQRIKEGLASDSQLKCKICHRVFPRPKSLRAHSNCHTGQTPYACDYPNCNKAFRQSGHLRSHTFRHTGEKPFRCPIPDCKERYLHANRHCSVHDHLKIVKLVRDGNETIDVKVSNLTEPEKQWLKRYENKKHNSRGTRRPAENDSDEENIPVNKKISVNIPQNNGYHSAGSESPSSSLSHESEISCTPESPSSLSHESKISCTLESPSSSRSHESEVSCTRLESPSSNSSNELSSIDLDNVQFAAGLLIQISHLMRMRKKRSLQ